MAKVWVGGTKPALVHLDTETYGAAVLTANEVETLIKELRKAVDEVRRVNRPKP
jgi:hypothetical protein